MTKLGDPTDWMTKAARLINTGLYEAVTVEPENGLHVVRGRYPDGYLGGQLAKFGDEPTAWDRAGVINRMAGVGVN